MEANQVVEKILSDAQNQAGEIKKQADEKRADEKTELDKQLKEYKEQTESLAKKAGEDKKAHMLAAARMDIAKEFLAEKRKIIDEIFEKAAQQFSKLQDDEYLKIIGDLMLETVETGAEEVIVDQAENRIDQNFINQINGKLGQDKKGDLKLSAEKQDIGAGFILKRGNIKTNVSLCVLMEQARKELEIELAKDLFAD